MKQQPVHWYQVCFLGSSTHEFHISILVSFLSVQNFFLDWIFLKNYTSSVIPSPSHNFPSSIRRLFPFFSDFPQIHFLVFSGFPSSFFLNCLTIFDQIHTPILTKLLFLPLYFFLVSRAFFEYIFYSRSPIMSVVTTTSMQSDSNKKVRCVELLQTNSRIFLSCWMIFRQLL